MGLVNIQYLKACVVSLKLRGIVEYDLCNTNREKLRTTEVNPTNNAAKRQQKSGQKTTNKVKLRRKYEI